MPWPLPRFTDNGDDTIIDTLTGLVWSQNGTAPGPATCYPNIKKTWQDALDYVACLNANSYLGYTDWRLPNINELLSLVNAEQSDTSTWLNNQSFNNVQSDSYWSSTSGANNTESAWIVVMWYGYVGPEIKSDFKHVWPVRSGQ